jgi:MYXO-CTERM domain-containing protein
MGSSGANETLFLNTLAWVEATAHDPIPDAVEGTGDSDGDGKPDYLDSVDNCRTVANTDQKDSDKDGTGDACDGTPGDAGAAGAAGTTGSGGAWDSGVPIEAGTEDGSAGTGGSSSGTPGGGTRSDDGGCGCRAAGGRESGAAWLALAAALGLGRRRRR